MEFPTLSRIIFFPLKKNTQKKIEQTSAFNFMADGNIHLDNIEDSTATKIENEELNFINSQVDIGNSSTILIKTISRFDVMKYYQKGYTNIVASACLNNIRWLNKFFEAVNDIIPTGGVYVGCVETKKERKKRILGKVKSPFNWLIYIVDFFNHRLLPKLWLTKRLYFFITKGKNRRLTKAETLGRLVSCGFEIITVIEISGKTWFAVKKISKPSFDSNPSYGPIYKMPRIGKGGKLINIYKIRTMHPYSEYLQEYMLRLNGYDDGRGKIRDDFRVTSYGVFFRRLWIDELPQIINVIKGEMNIVGVRPLSQARYNEFSEEMKSRRIRYKPGCLPPYVALLMGGEKENIKAEEIYFDQKDRHPIWTDVKFFFLSVYNIITNKIRSA